MTAPLPIGLVRGMPAAQYHADPGVSNTMLKSLADSPAHCYLKHLAPNRPRIASTDAQSLGTLGHAFILEPNAVGTRYAVKPRGMNFSTKAGKAWRDEQTLEIVTSDDADAAGAMVAAFKRVPVLANLLSSGVSEASVFAVDKATGLRVRCRPDHLHFTGPKRAVVLDVKTISELTPSTVERAIASYGYHRQQAHYTNVLQSAGIEVEEFVFGFVSSTYPYLAVAYVLDDETAEQGRDEVAELLDKFATCQRAGFWPAFGDGYQPIGLPAWARRNNEVEISYADN